MQVYICDGEVGERRIGTDRGYALLPNKEQGTYEIMLECGLRQRLGIQAGFKELSLTMRRL